MATVSRFVVKDCNLHKYGAVYRGPSSLISSRTLQTAHLGVSLPENGKGLSIQSKLSSPLVALSAPSRNPKFICNAAANVSGDAPTPSGMSQYERIIEALTTLFPVILGTVIGIYEPAAEIFRPPLLLVNASTVKHTVASASHDKCVKLWK